MPVPFVFVKTRRHEDTRSFSFDQRKRSEKIRTYLLHHNSLSAGPRRSSGVSGWADERLLEPRPMMAAASDEAAAAANSTMTESKVVAEDSAVEKTMTIEEEVDRVRKAFVDLRDSLRQRLDRYREGFAAAASSSSLETFFREYFRGEDLVETVSGPYVRLYDALGVSNRDELEEKIARLGTKADESHEVQSQLADLRRSLEDVESVEKIWDDLLAEIDQRLLANHVTSRGFQSVKPEVIELIDCDTGKLATRGRAYSDVAIFVLA